jgi:hypothetical protein
MNLARKKEKQNTRNRDWKRSQRPQSRLSPSRRRHLPPSHPRLRPPPTSRSRRRCPPPRRRNPPPSCPRQRHPPTSRPRRQRPPPRRRHPPLSHPRRRRPQPCCPAQTSTCARNHVGHKGKFGPEFLKFEFHPNGQLCYANNSNDKIRRPLSVSKICKNGAK